MNFTFGIITSINSCNYINDIIISIENQNIPNYEIIIIGQINKDLIHNFKNTTIIEFNENIKPQWITKKKNIITELSKYENIVFLHDYILFEPNWYNGFIEFDKEYSDWEISMCKVKNIDGKRAIDWMGLPNDTKYGNVLLPYHYRNPKGMYIPGNFWIAKKNVMQKYPLNENLLWGQAEDIEWSKRVLGGAIYSTWLRNMIKIPMNKEVDETTCINKYYMNTYSSVIYLKNKPTTSDFCKEYDAHSGSNSRPLGYNREDYEYLIKTNRL
jgi:hypothetical protein